MKIPKWLLAAGLLMMLASGPAVSAADKDIVILQGDVVNLRKAIQDLQESMNSKNAAMTSQVEKIADNVNNLNVALQKIVDAVAAFRQETTAANAATASNISTTRETMSPLATQLTNIQKSMVTVNEEMTGMRTQMKVLSDSVIAMKATSSPLPTCKDLKQDADRSFISNYFDDAITGYREFMAQCASDPKAPEVQLQIADALYNVKKYDQAILDYDIFLKNYPPNDKTASALLRKGLAQTELKQTAEAKATFTRITKEFTGTSEANTAAAKLKDLTAAPAGRGRGNP